MKFHISLYRWCLSNSRFGDFIDRIYPIELEIKDTTDTDRSASWHEFNTTTVVRLPQWLGWPLCNIYVTNDHGYVSLVVSTSRSFPHLWLLTGYVTRLTRRVSPACTHRYADSLLKNTSTKHSIIMSSSVNVPEKTGLVNFNPSSSSIKIKPQKVSLLGHFRDSENSCFDGGKDHIISH
jgi:hypothetical protein